MARKKVEHYPRRVVFERDGNRCVYCGVTKGQMTLDHIIPVSKGGAYHDARNLVVSCQTCNQDKGSMMLSEWRPWLVTRFPGLTAREFEEEMYGRPLTPAPRG